MYEHVLIFLGRILRIGMARSGDHSMAGILWNCWAVFCSTCTIFHSHKERVRSPVSLHPSDCLLLPDFFIAEILVSLKWKLSVAFYSKTKEANLMVPKIYVLGTFSTGKKLCAWSVPPPVGTQ